MENLIKSIQEKIKSIKNEVIDITDQIETFRNECDDDFGVTGELQDKLEILNEKISALKKNLSIYQNSQITDDVSIGNTVKISNSRSTKTITIVLPEDADSAAGLISHESPLGNALLSRRVGEEVMVITPGGEMSFKVNNVK